MISVSLSAEAKLETETRAFTGCHWTTILDPSIGNFRFSTHNLTLIISAEVPNLIHAINSGIDESALASPTLLCSEEKWPWAKLVLVAPTGNQQFKIEKTPCHWTVIPVPSIG